MKEIDWEKCDKDYEVPLNPAALFDYSHVCLSQYDYFAMFADTYLRCADTLLLEFFDNPTNICSAGIIFRACVMAIELRLKSFVSRNSHDLMTLMQDVQKQYVFFGNNELCYIEFINRTNSFAYGSQTGRYPVDKQNKPLCAQKDGVLYLRVGQMVYLTHDLFDNYFSKLLKKVEIEV